MNARTLAIVALSLASPSSAQVQPPSGNEVDVPTAVQPCAACHGPSGEGDAAQAVPRIAAQSQHYIVRQLRSFAAGTRRNPAMEAIARSLSTQEMMAIAAYFAQIDAPPSPGIGAGALHEHGRILATSGSRELGVPACANCHGPRGQGAPPASPYLAGLDARYITAAILAWKAGTRRNDAGLQMKVIADALTPDAITAVARYYASLPPPAPLPANYVRVGIADTTGPPATAPAMAASASAARGRAILASGQYGCAACHTIPGVRGARGIVGPSLHGFADRPLIAGRLPNRAGVLRAFILDPPAYVPETGMPDVGLADRDARDIAAYLRTLTAR